MQTFIIKFDYFLLLISGYILFALTVLTNGFLFLTRDNATGFHLGAALSLALGVAAIIRAFFRQSSVSIYIRISVLLLALILIGVIVLWLQAVSSGI